MNPIRSKDPVCRTAEESPAADAPTVDKASTRSVPAAVAQGQSLVRLTKPQNDAEVVGEDSWLEATLRRELAALDPNESLALRGEGELKLAYSGASSGAKTAGSTSPSTGRAKEGRALPSPATLESAWARAPGSTSPRPERPPTCAMRCSRARWWRPAICEPRATWPEASA